MNNRGADQTAFVVRIWHKQIFSWRGSYVKKVQTIRPWSHCSFYTVNSDLFVRRIFMVGWNTTNVFHLFRIGKVGIGELWICYIESPKHLPPPSQHTGHWTYSLRLRTTRIHPSASMTFGRKTISSTRNIWSLTTIGLYDVWSNRRHLVKYETFGRIQCLIEISTKLFESFLMVTLPLHWQFSNIFTPELVVSLWYLSKTYFWGLSNW